MASAFSHAIFAVAIGSALEMPPSACVLGAALSVVPDLDVIGFRFGINGAGPLGHRGFTHSLLFAGLVATAVVLAYGDRWSIARSHRRRVLWLYLFLATASHGVLDGFTNGGLGVAFYAPFDNARYFFPVRLLRVSPVVAQTLFTPESVVVTPSELVWVWIPSIALIVAAHYWRSRRSTRRSTAATSTSSMFVE
jgi:inner membrane protein